LEQRAPVATHSAFDGSQQLPPGAHELLPQHAWPTPPHPPQLPVELHVLVVVSHVPFEQTSPAQQGSPAPPHATQDAPLLSQTVPPRQTFLPDGSTQHASPLVPQRVQTSATQSVPSLHVVPLQHAAPTPPQPGFVEPMPPETQE